MGQYGSSKVFEAADLLVSPRLLLRGSMACGVGRWPVMAGDSGDENFEGRSCAKIPKLPTGRSHNSCLDCKIGISVTSKALEMFRAI